MRNFLSTLLGLVFVAGFLWASPALARAPFGGVSVNLLACTANGSDGYQTTGSFQQPQFFAGFANQSWNQSPSFGAGATIYQKSTYSRRPSHCVAGVDYPIGVPATVVSAGYKDPAEIGTDALANPDGNNTDCVYYASTVDNPSGVPAPNKGPEVYCSYATPAHPILIQGYNFGEACFSAACGGPVIHDCVYLVIKGNTWSSFTQDSNLHVNGQNCNSNGGGNNPQNSEIYYVSGNSFPKFYTNDTYYGCGGPSPYYGISEYRYPDEAYWCNLNFVQGAGTFSITASISGTGLGNMTVSAVPAGSGNGPIAIGETLTVPGCTGLIQVTGFYASAAGGTGQYTVSNPNGCAVSGVTISSYTVQATGVAPFDNRVVLEYSDGNTTVEYIAMIHQPGHFSNGGSQCMGYTQTDKFNYTEGMGYLHAGNGAALGLGEHAEFLEYGDGCTGSRISNSAYNTYLLTAAENGGDAGSSNPEGGEASFYMSGGGQGSPGNMAFTGYNDHEIYVCNTSPIYTVRATVHICGVGYQDNDFTGGVTSTNSWFDQTGGLQCDQWDQGVAGAVITLNGNQSLLGPAFDYGTNILATLSGPRAGYVCPGAN